jgi:hypothetical protein
MGWWEDNNLVGMPADVAGGGITGGKVYAPGGSGSFDEKSGSYGEAGGWNGPLVDQTQPPAGPAATTNAPQGGQNYQQIVEQLMGGSNDPEKLKQIAPQLQQYGIKLSNQNASGELSKVILPDGTAVRVIGAGEGHATWLPQPGTGSAGGQPGALTNVRGTGNGSQGNLYNPDDLTAGFTQAFQRPSGEPGADPFTEQFHAPTADEARQFPGYQFALEQGLQGIDRGAASNGTLLTMGNQKDRSQFATGLADQTYQNLYNNQRGEFADRFNIHASNAANASSAYGSSYDRAMNEYLNAFNIFNTNQGNLFNRLSGVSGQGLSAAGGQAGAAQNIGQAGANANTNAGNAQGGGAIATGNANANEATTIGQLGTGLWDMGGASSYRDPGIYGQPGVNY